jgi:hypothetical protein
MVVAQVMGAVTADAHPLNESKRLSGGRMFCDTPIRATMAGRPASSVEDPLR